MVEGKQLLNIIILGGIALAVGGLVVGSLFSSSVKTFTDAFIGLGNTGNYTGATASIGALVPLVWVLGFLLAFLGVGLKLIQGF